MKGPSSATTTKTAGPATSASLQPARGDPRRIGEPRHHHDDPHRGEDGAGLKRAAGLVRADPEDMQADEDADRRDHAREEDQRAVRLSSAERRRRAAPEAVGRDRPDADDREQKHGLLQHRVEGAIDDQHRGDGIAEARGFESALRLGREGRRRLRQNEDDGRQRAGDHQAEQRRERLLAGARPVARLDRERRAQSRSGGHQQNAGRAAADRRLGERDIRRQKADPDDREDQPIGDIADDRAEQLARENGPGRDADHEKRQTEIEKLIGITRPLRACAGRRRSSGRPPRSTVGRAPREGQA